VGLFFDFFTFVDPSTRSDMGLSRVAEVRTRSVIVSNLPANTQEGLLQQMLQKIMPIKRIEVFLDKKLAVVELENQAVGFARYCRIGFINLIPICFIRMWDGYFCEQNQSFLVIILLKLARISEPRETVLQALVPRYSNQETWGRQDQKRAWASRKLQS
jgi:hypothetical protein